MLVLIFIILVLLLSAVFAIPHVTEYFSLKKEERKSSREDEKSKEILKKSLDFHSSSKQLLRREYFTCSEEAMEEFQDEALGKDENCVASEALTAELKKLITVTDEHDPRLNVIDKAIDAGVNPNVVYVRETPVMFAVTHWMLPALKRMTPIDLNVRFKEFSLMHMLARREPKTEEEMERADATVKFLLDAGLDINTPTDQSRYTPLELAIEAGKVNMAKILLENGAIAISEIKI